VAGTVTVRRPEGEQALCEGDVLVFRRGPDGGHDVRNHGDAPARVLIFSNLADPEVCVYPDSGKVGVWAGDTVGHKLHLMNRVEDNLDYMEGEE
jgi:uncharacterized cupin superfamily protein